MFCQITHLLFTSILDINRTNLPLMLTNHSICFFKIAIGFDGLVSPQSPKSIWVWNIYTLQIHLCITTLFKIFWMRRLIDANSPHHIPRPTLLPRTEFFLTINWVSGICNKSKSLEFENRIFKSSAWIWK